MQKSVGTPNIVKVSKSLTGCVIDAAAWSLPQLAHSFTGSNFPF